MLSSLVSAGTKALGGARFSLINVFPGTLLVAIVLFTARSGAYETGEASIGAAIPTRDELTAGSALVVLFALFVIGVLIQPFQVALVQYLEGYWGNGALGRSFGAIAVELHRRRFRTAVVELDTRTAPPSVADLARVAAYARADVYVRRVRSRAASILRRYPTEPSRFMPTMLGNILRNAEDSAGSRYGLDAMTVFPRMYPTLSKPLAEAVSRQLDLITVTASMCVSFSLAAIATAPVLLRVDLWSVVPVAALLLGVLSYRGALHAAASHGTLFATTFDLHRFDMLRALHYTLPTDAAKERLFNEELTRFLQGRVPAHREFAEYAYDHSTYNGAVPSLVESANEETSSESSGHE